MARGDVKFFASFFQKGMDAISFDINAGDTLKMGLVTSSTVPAVGTSDPRWGSGGSTNFSTNEVATGTSYTGPITLSTVIWTRTSGVVKLDFDDVSVTTDGSGFTNAAYAIVYDDTVSGKYAIGFIDLGGPVSIVTGDLDITINASGFGTLTAT